MIRHSICLCLSLCLTLSCNVKQRSCPEEEARALNGQPPEEDAIRYAAGYRVTHHDGYTSVEVRDPWNEGRLLQHYLLAPRDKPLPANLPRGGTVVRVPLRKVAVYAAVHCAALDELGVIDAIAGVCEPRYIRLPAIGARIRQGLIWDLGESASPNVEKMIALGTEAVLASPFEHGSYGAVEKLGIPVIECADYMEADPLGRAEWLKFIGLLTGRRACADSLFRRTEANYLRIRGLAAEATRHPTLMTGMKYGSSWYVPSGESFMARIYADAGADYLFRRLPGAGSTPLSFETVLDEAIHADVWLLFYNREEDMTYKALASDYPPYSRFDAFRHRRIYACNTNRSAYYEEMPLHPDYLLEDLIALFHPHLRTDGYGFRYFTPPAEE